MPDIKKEWILEMPVQSLLRVMQDVGPSELYVFEEPAVLIFMSDEGEETYSVEGFKTLEKAKNYMEKKFHTTEGYMLDGVFFYGKEMEWKEVRSFDFREMKTERR